MKKILFTLILSTLFLASLNTSYGNKTNEIKPFEALPFNPDMVIKDCNVTYVYWEKIVKLSEEEQFTVRLFGEEHVVKEIVITSSIVEVSYYMDMINSLYNIKKEPEINATYYEYIKNVVTPEFENVLMRIMNETNIPIYYRHVGVYDTDPITVYLGVFNITKDKIEILNSYLKPLANKYNALVFYFESVSAEQFKEKQDKALDNFFVDNQGWEKYLDIVQKYYGVKFERNYGYGNGRVELPVPPNSTLNEAFVKEVVNLIRSYVSCDIPLEIDFVYYREIILAFLPADPTQHIQYAAIIFVVLLSSTVILITKGYFKRNKKVF